MSDVSPSRPRRILALDGGGVRGIVSIAFLERIEALLRERTGRKDLVLAQHFDLIGGTSVGSILATMLALGWPTEKVRDTFFDWCPNIFGNPRWFSPLRTKFSARALDGYLRTTLGSMTLEDPALKCRLAIIMKRIDTGSPWWIVSNNPQSEWWGEPYNNRTLKVADLVRASTAAPTVFEPKSIRLRRGEKKARFVDGGLSPFNNPSLALLMLVGLKGHGMGWTLGADNLSLTSIGTGAWREPVRDTFWTRQIAANLGVQALRGMITDNQALSLMLLQWMSEPRRPWEVNAEVKTMQGDLLGPGAGPHSPLMKFQRYDLDLEETALKSSLGEKKLTSRMLKHLRDLDDPAELKTLYQLAQEAALAQVDVADFS